MPSKGRIVLIAGSLCLAAASIIVVFDSMNALMTVGGSCAEGGAYVIRQRCPSGSIWTLAGGIVVGIVFLRVYVTANSQLPGPHLEALAWPALVLSLGVPFLLFGLDPGQGEGSAPLWIILGIALVIVGVAPVLLLLRPDIRRRVLWADALQPASQARVPVTPTSDDVAASLVHITELHDRGSLTDEEFISAKRRILAGEVP